MEKRGIMLILTGCLLCTAAACGQEAEMEQEIAIVQEYEGMVYPTATAEYGDVVRAVKVSCIYEPTEQEDLSFSVDGKYIEQVAVAKGDIVVKGDLLAALEDGNLAEQAEETEYQLESLSLELAHIKEWQEFDTASTRLLFSYTAMTKDDEERLEEELAAIKARYAPEITELEDAIYIAQKRLEQYQKEIREGRLVAGITGEVTFMKDLFENPYSEAGERVITISNLESCCFTTSDTAYADYFKEAENLQVEYLAAGVQGFCEVEPVYTEQWDGKMFFRPVNEELLDRGISGSITLELERKSNVLCIPSEAIHESDGELFVYVSENGLLQMRTITAGLQGADMTEVTGGLTQGETIALKK